MCRYVARPALASGRLRLLASQRFCFALKTPWSDGTRHLLLSPMELLEKLAALVPPPRLHLLRYDGVLAPVPATAAASCRPNRLRSRRRRTALRALLPAPIACGGRSCWRGCFPPTSAHARPVAGRLRINAALTDSASIRTYLEGLGLPAVPPPRAPPPPFEFAA